MRPGADRVAPELSDRSHRAPAYAGREPRQRSGESARSHYTYPQRKRPQMRTTWNGSLSFGLVNIPVGLAPATAPKARASDVSFRTLHRECGTPIKQKRWCPVHEREVSNDELVKGWEVAKGQFVIVEDADLEAIEQRDTSRAIEISRFVPLERGRPGLLRPHLLPRARRARRRSAGPTCCC